MTQMRLRTVPLSLREANAFVSAEHRHHGRAVGHKLSTGVVDEDDQLRGVMILGRPVARAVDHRLVAEVTRLATDGCPNACSALYGQACRIADAIGYEKVQTYILDTEPGTSLLAAGWRPVHITQGGSWDTPTRHRLDTAPLNRKVRWECRHSALPSVDLSRMRVAA